MKIKATINGQIIKREHNKVKLMLPFVASLVNVIDSIVITEEIDTDIVLAE